MKNCPNCGAPIDPYRVKCEYCGTTYFDLVTWLQDGKPCFINYSFNSIHGKGILTTQAIPHLETIEVNSEPSYAITENGTHLIAYGNKKTCEINIKFDCIENTNNKTLFQLNMAGAGSSPK
jgi:hypothetical protein